MGRGRRYNDEGQLNYKKVLAVIIALAVVVMVLAIMNKLVTKGKEESKVANVSYYALYQDNKWGIIDTEGNKVIEPMYQEMIIVLNNKQDVFLCTYDINEKTGTYKTKLVNKNNEEIYKGYDKIEPLVNYDKNNNMWYEEDTFKVEKNGKYGLIDIYGKEVLSTQYDDIDTLKGLKNSLIVKKGNEYGLVNTSGVTILSTSYQEIKGLDDNYKHGYITVDSDKKYGLVNVAGTKILENKYEKIEQIYGENHFVIEEDGDQKVIDKDGNVVLEDGFDEIIQINADGVVFVEDDEYGFMDYEGRNIINPQFDDLKELNTGILKAKKDDEYGIIDLKENEKLSFDYKDIYYEENAGFYIAEKNDYNSEIIDLEFNVKLKGIISELNKEKGYMKIKLNNQYKYYNFKFEEKDVKEALSSNTLFVSKKDKKYGFVDKEGNVVVDYIYDEAQEQNQYGYAAVKSGNKWGAINSEGKVVVEPKYDLDDYLLVDFIGKWHLGQDLNMNYYCEK